MSHNTAEDPATQRSPDTHDSNKYRTLTEWCRLGRSVEGAKAHHYSVNPDTGKGVAVYHEDQTTPLEVWDQKHREGWILMPTDEYQISRKKAHVRACWFPPRLGLWVLKDEVELIARLKKHKWRFRPAPRGAEPANRYWLDIGTKDPMVTIQAIEALGIQVKLEQGFINRAPIASPPTTPAPKPAPTGAELEARAGEVLRDMPTIGPVKLSESTGMDLPTAQAWLKEHRPEPVTRGPFGKPMPEQPKMSGLARQRKVAA